MEIDQLPYTLRKGYFMHPVIFFVHTYFEWNQMRENKKKINVMYYMSRCIKGNSYTFAIAQMMCGAEVDCGEQQTSTK